MNNGLTEEISGFFKLKNGLMRSAAVIGPLQFLLLFFLIAGASAADMEIVPFAAYNQSPLTSLYGIPHETGSDIVPQGAMRLSFNQDLSSNYTVYHGVREQILLDGETYRMSAVARWGVAPRLEAGIELPYIVQGGGFLDGLVINWHNFFGLPQGGRDGAVKDRLYYRYVRDGVVRLNMNQSGSGIGDIRLTGGIALAEVRDAGRHDTLALKGVVKLPTGASTNLRGSGGADIALQLCGSLLRSSEWGSLGLYGSVGGMAMSRGDVLSDQHNPLAGFGAFGIGWGPASWISFKAQLNASTALYRDSNLAELAQNPVMLIFGGSLAFPGEYLLDIGVTEDIAVATAPDVGFHLGLSKQF